MKPARVLWVCLLLIATSSLSVSNDLVYETQLAIPTFTVNQPDPNPRFYAGRVYQGAQGRIYPYPMSDVLTNQKVDSTYTAIVLENELIKITVLPQIGGRIFEAVDKTNDYDFFYKQSVIKPSLIGMLGAWMSGGVEWNFPHHHRANTFMPMDYTIKHNADGSSTLWLTEIERRHRMKMLIGLTIWPDRSILQAELKFFNRTPFVHSFLYFANPSVHVDSTYQVIFPPEAQYVTQHAKREFAQWPVADARYGGYDYNNVDISWWKNLPKSVSFFCWDHTADYFAGYNHGKNAGVAYVADVHVAPGKKFFTFGCGDRGKMWDKMLTDTDGPYLELMAGAYSDNQPDYSWIQPYEVKTITQTWFPIKELGGMSFANVNGALNLELNENAANLNILATSLVRNAQILLFSGKKQIYSSQTDLSPNAAWRETISLPAETKQVSVVVRTNDQELMRYQPPQNSPTPMPQPVSPPIAPEKYDNNEQLYLTGLRLDQFYNPQIDPYPYYFEALKRDSMDARVNTQLGILYSKRGMWPNAEKHLQRAVDRLTYNYTRAKDGEAHYYLGVAQRESGRLDKAYDVFYRAAWDFGWRAASYYALAELDCQNGEFDNALSHVNEALIVNAQNTKALNLKAIILRQLGRFEKALAIIENVNQIDPLDYWGRHERQALKTALGQSVDESAITQIDFMHEDVELYLEVATDYAGAGFYADAISVLERIEKQTNYPLVFYYLGYYYQQQGEYERAKHYFETAAAQPFDYVFPFRLESIKVLTMAINQNPDDSRAPYYLGNLLYDWQPERAINLWHQTVEQNDDFAPAFRNLGVGYAQHKNDPAQSIEFYERAIELNPDDPRLYYELDVMYENQNVAPQTRLALLQEHRKTVFKRDDALSRLVETQVLTGKYDAALDILTANHFNTWEGGGSIHDVFVNAHLMRGLDYLASKKYKKALADFETALDYPDNLEVGRPIVDPDACRTFVLLGQTHQALGNEETAIRYFEKAAALPTSGDMNYYQAKALEFLGQVEKAKALYRELIKTGQQRLEGGELDFFAKFGERQAQNRRLGAAYYLIALGNLGLGELEKAGASFLQAQSYDINNVWVNYYLKTI